MARDFKQLWLLAALLLAACQEGGEAGDLLGQWRMTGSSDKYVSFSGSVALFRIINVEKSVMTVQAFGNFQHRGDSLFIQCYPMEEWPQNVSGVEEDFGFKPFGDIRLKIDVLSSDRLVVSKDGRQWSFGKY